MNLKPIESRILRSFGKPGRELAAVTSLLQKGLLTVAGAHVEPTDAGRAWIVQDAERVRQARAAGGGTRYIGKRRLIEIASTAARASHAPGAKRKKRAKKKPD